MKKVWEAPEVLAVVHGSPEEAVLLTCFDSASCEFDLVDGTEPVGADLTALS